MIVTNIKMTENHVTNTNLVRLCRCCALEHDAMYDIFSGTCSNAQTYYEVVMECAPVQLYIDDGLPSLVCQTCVSILESFVVFRRKCVESESVLKQMRDIVSPDRREMFDSSRVKRDDPILDNIKEESEDIVDTVEPLAAFKFVEVKIENTSVNDNYTDTYSQVGGIDQGLFNVREERIDNDYDESEKRYLDADRGGERLTVKEQPYSYDECDEMFDKEANLIVHQITHADEKPYSCDACGKSFERKWTLDKHRKTHTSDKPYACDACDKSFTHRWTLAKHRRIHTGERPYSCDGCGKSFLRKSSLDEHRNIHTGERPYACDACDKSFRLKSNLNEHRKAHVCEKPHACERPHACEKHYACDECEKTFKCRSSLNKHRKMHAGENAYRCGECDKSYSVKWNLDRHRQVHAGDSAYRCGVCDRSYSMKWNLERHLKIHADDEPYVSATERVEES